MATKSVKSALIMSIAISCLVSLFSASMPASATVHTSQLNVNGIHEGALRYAAEPNNLHPRAITGNEVCGSKGQSAPSPLDRLKFALAYNGYAYALWPQNSDSVLCGGAPTYNIVGLLGDVVSTGVYIFPGQAPGDSSPQRNAVCVRTQFIFNQYFACGAQMAARGSDYNYAYLQAEDFRLNYLQSRLNTPQLIGGDFNMRPDQSFGQTGWFSVYHEADVASNPQQGTHPREFPPRIKIDYSFGDNYHYTNYFGIAGVACDSATTRSDHCYYHGTFQ